MKIKNLFLISFFLISSSCFASSKRITEMDKDKFIGSVSVYKKFKASNDPEIKEAVEYAADIFAQYFALANRIGGEEMITTLSVLCEDAPKELIERGEAEAHRQGVTILEYNTSKKK